MRGCTLDFRPVCGSNGEVYANRCILETVACQNPDKNITEDCKGECPCDDSTSPTPDITTQKKSTKKPRKKGPGHSGNLLDTNSVSREDYKMIIKSTSDPPTTANIPEDSTTLTDDEDTTTVGYKL